MSNRPETFREGLERVASHAREAEVGFAAAALAYYALVALLPLLLVGVAVATAVAGDWLVPWAIGLASGSLSPEATSILRRALRAAAARRAATVGSAVVLLWAGLRFFRGLKMGIVEAYDTGRDASLPRQLLDSLATLAAVSTAVALLLAGTVAASHLGLPGGVVTQTVGTLLALTVVYTPLYYLLPEASVSLTEALPGAAVAAGAWLLLVVGFRAYLVISGGTTLYSVLGSVVVLATWLYFASLAVLLGAVVNAVLAGRDDGTTLGEG